MNFNGNNLEDTLFHFLDQIKALLTQEIWDSILLDSSKNELLVLILLYRQSDVNMTSVADYLNVPLNTATGIVARMEKKQLVQRLRSEADKRVVTIVFTELGKQQMSNVLGTFIGYGQRIVAALTTEEIGLLGDVMSKVIQVLKDKPKELTQEKKVKKIVIE